MVYDFFEKEFSIPQEWEYPKFNEVVKTNPSTKIESKTIPYIPMDSVDVEKPSFNYTEERLLSENSSLAKFQDNDVLFARITPSTENGKTSFVENFKKKGIVSSELTVLRPTEKVFPKYLYYYMKSHKIRQFAISQMMGTTGRQRVPDFVFKKDLYFELPLLSEQQKIASILSNVDNLIQNTDKLIEKTTRLKKGLMQELLTRGIGHTKFKKVMWYFGKEIEIPEEWEVKKLGENSTLKGRIGWQGLTTKEYRKEGEFHLVTGTDFRNGMINWKTCVFVDKDRYDQDQNIQLKNDDVLITKDGTIGKIAIVDEHPFPATLNTGVFIVRPIEKKYLPLFLYYILNSNYFLKFINRFKGGSTINHLYQKDFVKFTFLIPSLLEQQQIASILSNTDEKIQSYERYKEKLQCLKKSLMQKLLTGEVRVAV